MASGKFVSYLRVSTVKQGDSGLGLEAQRSAVTSYLNGGKWSLLKESLEVESGKRNDRPALAEALKLCKRHKATLIIAKLDRLARNVAFIANLMESGVEFIAVDMPQATKFTIHIMAAVAEQEAEAISKRTKAALQAAKERGTRLGGRRVSVAKFAKIAVEGRKIAAAVRSRNAASYRDEILPIIGEIQTSGITTLSGIASALNERGETTRRGGQWSAVQVMRVLNPATA
ncbi:recombinase family protein [Terriglobus sp. TAA 43]|uniref:recombinase family protein n=1 Tax=Terriglobus sp. TAA 43 TaxID=278961 RepID=UPI0006462B7A|nr:recombinase family protein [Terriglobus sp. TAA 43]